MKTGSGHETQFRILLQAFALRRVRVRIHTRLGIFGNEFGNGLTHFARTPANPASSATLRKKIQGFTTIFNWAQLRPKERHLRLRLPTPVGCQIKSRHLMEKVKWFQVASIQFRSCVAYWSGSSRPE